MNFVVLNNKLIGDKEINLNNRNRGFLYGDGFFESIKIFNQSPFNFNNHYNRIEFSADFLNLEFLISKEELLKKINELLLQNDIVNGSVRITIFRDSDGKYYPINNETMNESVNREVKATRDSLGILDASTLGKIDLKGRDVSEFLNRVYTNAWSKLAIGKCRYGVMLGDDGMVIDDGVTTRLGEHHYLMTTTTGNAASVMSKLEDWLQTEWPELEVYLTSVTEQFGTISLNGPNSRKIVESLFPTQNFSSENFPHMSFKELKIDGILCRVMRISFTGEICYEINVPASYALSLWDMCMSLGEKYNITPYGTEAMHVLRAGKGYIIVGQETDGSVTPIDLDMSWIVSKKKYDFIGKRALNRSDTIKEDRKQLVGILTTDPSIVLEEGSQLVEVETSLPMPMVGHITSSYYSPNLGRSIALALIKSGIKKKGTKLIVPTINKSVEVEITNPVFIDPKNERLLA